MANSWWPTAGNGGEKNDEKANAKGGAAQGPASCPFCGAGNSKRSLVCWSCGKKLTQSAIDEAAKQKVQSEEDAYRRDYEVLQNWRFDKSGGVDVGPIPEEGDNGSSNAERVRTKGKILPSWRLDEERIEMPGVYSFLYYIFLVAFFLGLISLVIGIFTLSAAMLASGVSMIVTSLLVNLFLGIWSSTERTATYLRQLVELMKKETSQGPGGEC